MCRVGTLDELLECVKFLAGHDDVAQQLASNGWSAIGQRLLTRDQIARRAADALRLAARVGRTSEVEPTTHPLFGVTNHEAVAKRAWRFDH